MRLVTVFDVPGLMLLSTVKCIPDDSTEKMGCFESIFPHIGYVPSAGGLGPLCPIEKWGPATGGGFLQILVTTRGSQALDNLTAGVSGRGSEYIVSTEGSGGAVWKVYRVR